MSEEEKIISYIQEQYGDFDSYIRDLLDLYNKEKEKNKEIYDKGYKEGYIKGVQPQIFDNWEKANIKTIKTKSNFISKDKIKELKKLVHKTLDDNGITRAFQLVIDDYFDSVLEE